MLDPRQVKCLRIYLKNRKRCLYIKAKPIFNSFLAKQLLHCGNPIVDLQKNKTLQNATIFYFEETNKFINDLKKLTTE